jgi:hypothetical protein
MKSVSWALLLSDAGLAPRRSPAGSRAVSHAAQLIRRRDGAVLLAPIDVRLARAARQRAPALY